MKERKRFFRFAFILILGMYAVGCERATKSEQEHRQSAMLEDTTEHHATLQESQSTIKIDEPKLYSMRADSLPTSMPKGALATPKQTAIKLEEAKP